VPAPSGRTPRLPAGERRRQLLDAALEILATQGFDAVNVESVARRAGVTRPVVYDQFGDLDGLLVALVDREEATALAPLDGILSDPDDDMDPDRFLVDGVRSFLRAVRAAPRTWRLVLMPPDGGSADLRERVQRSRRTITARVAELLRWGIDARGGPQGLDLDLLARLVVAVGEDGARLVVAHPRRYSPDRMAALVERLVALVPRTGEIPAAREFASQPLPEPRAVAAGGGRVPRAERREQLLDHALALIGEEGFDALNIESVSRAADVNRVIVYRAFAGLPGLLLALMRREQARVQAQLDALVPTEPGDRTPQELLAQSLEGFLEIVTGDVLTWRVALLRPESAPAIVQQVVRRQRSDLARRLRPLVVWGLGGLPLDVDESDADLLARLLLTVAEELGRVALEEPTFPRERLADSTRRFLSLLPWA
jgi:AcrR family transcriptional regulator